MQAAPSKSALSRPTLIVSWVLQVTAALIFLQTLFFKFTGAEEARFIFQTLGAEPWGRWGVGLAELVAAALLLTPRTVPIGAALAAALMLGAILSHLTKLGIVVKDDGGTLFTMALVVLAAASAVLVIRRDQARALLRSPRRNATSST